MNIALLRSKADYASENVVLKFQRQIWWLSQVLLARQIVLDYPWNLLLFERGDEKLITLLSTVFFLE